MADRVIEVLNELESLDHAELRKRWAVEFGQIAPWRASRDLLARGIVYRIQEKDGGGLRPVTVRRLHRIMVNLKHGGAVTKKAAPTLQPGVRLMREWNGETHVVEVLADGFAWRGGYYSSLSAIARAITGVRWSGPRFFGLHDKRQGKAENVSPDTGS